MARRPLVLGLTGSIGMGKTTVATQFARLGARVCDADHIVHRLLRKGGEAVPPVAKHFPGVVKDGAVDRAALGAIVFHDAEKRALLERLIHPLVAKKELEFVRKAQRSGARLVVLDIPLLFEAGADRRCDVTLTVTSPPFIQRRRVLQRPRMTPDKFRHILAAQLPDREKQNRADFVIHTGLGKAYSMRETKTLATRLFSPPPWRGEGGIH